MKNALLAFCLLALFSFSEASENGLSFEEALECTLAHSKSLEAGRAAIEMRIGERIQASTYPNPFFAYSVENVFGNKHWKGWDAAESRYELAQPIILGSKREHRQKLTAYEYSAALAEYSALEISLSNELKKAFLETAAAEELYRLACEQKMISQEIVKAVHAKIDAGKISPTAKNKALLENASSDLALKKALVDLESKKKVLSLFWGAPCPGFQRVAYPFYAIEPLRCLQECQNLLCDHPAFIQASFLSLAARERLKLEKAERIPDITVTVGYKSEREWGESGMILGAALPLPFFDYNQGNVYKAKAEICRFESIASEIELKLASVLLINYAEAERSYQEVLQLRDEILKLAEEAFFFAKRGYEEGKFEYLDLLDAQRTLFEVQGRTIQAILEFQKNKTDIEYLTL